MGKFQNILKELRVSKGITQVQLAKQLGISRSTVGMYENGSREPDFETLELIADYFNVDTDYLLGRTNKTTYIPVPNSSCFHSKGIPIPVYGRVAAGVPLEMIEDIIDTEEITEEMFRTGEFFALQIHGDSMEPKMSEGDIVIVRKQEDAESGDTVIATVNGTDATCKRLRKYRDGIELIATNPSYEPMYFSNTEVDDKPVRILGRVVELRAKF